MILMKKLISVTSDITPFGPQTIVPSNQGLSQTQEL